MAQISDFTSTWTAEDLTHRFGAIPLHRVLQVPAPGTATVADVVRLDAQHDRLCELVDGTLVEKTMGYLESLLAIEVARLLGNFVNKAKLGTVAGEAGMMQLSPNQVRIPDVSFISWEQLKGSGFPDNPVPNVAPTLAVEIISKSNTPQEMNRKLAEYFEAGTRLVWYVYPEQRQVNVYTSVTDLSTLGENDALTGGDILPGFSMDLKTFFSMPTDSETAND